MKNSKTSICGETRSHYLGECLGSVRKPLTISGRVKEFALPFRNHKTHSSGSAAFEGAGFTDPCMADVTFATGRVNLSWESAEPSQTMHGSIPSLFAELPAQGKENCKNNQRNKPLLAATRTTKPAFPPSTVPSRCSSVPRVQTKHGSSSLISPKSIRSSPIIRFSGNRNTWWTNKYFQLVSIFIVSLC